MSIDAVAAELREALDKLLVDLLLQAATSFDEARTVLAAASQGTSRPEAGAAIQLLSTAVTQVGDVRETVSTARGLVEQYIAHIAGGVQADAPQRPSPAQMPTKRQPPQQRLRPGVDAALVDEVQRQGKWIKPEKVVRIERDKAGKVVWLEEGDERSGLGHLLLGKRVDDFTRMGIAKNEIVDLVFNALGKGEPVGITGRDRVVYAVEHRGQLRRVAISVGPNGYIVGANPISLTRKVKPLP